MPDRKMLPDFAVYLSSRVTVFRRDGTASCAVCGATVSGMTDSMGIRGILLRRPRRVGAGWRQGGVAVGDGRLECMTFPLAGEIGIADRGIRKNDGSYSRSRAPGHSPFAHSI